MIYAPTISIGIDIGSVSINMVAVDSGEHIVASRPYLRHFGRFMEYLPREFEALLGEVKKGWLDRVAFTGTHGMTVSGILGLPYEVETTASITGLSRVAPDARSVVAIGGFDSAYYTIASSRGGFNRLENFSLNEACAAGSGSFIDQQAERIFAEEETCAAYNDPQERIERILDRFIALGKTSEAPANVACRCTVFTKSDMIHLQNRGIKAEHIIRGLHDGVAKNFKSTLICTLPIREPLFMIGGYSKNALACSAFEELLGYTVRVPDHASELGAYGAVLKAREKRIGRPVQVEEFGALADREELRASRNAPLQISRSSFCENIPWEATEDRPEKVPCYLGLDVGSTTTKVVLIEEGGTLRYKRYISTEGQPVTAIKKAFHHLTAQFGSRPEVLGVGATGSGREVAALFVGADDVVNEITAHAMGTLHRRPDVDTIFELGGQDAKYTRLERGAVRDFRMNKVCAAGTGSFLEETANKLGIAIDGEYEALALGSRQPLKLAERCTVFMEADLMSHLQQGAPKEDLLAGLAYAVVHNYLNRVVGDGKVGEVISFQGGPSLNKAVVAAFQGILGKGIITLPDREVVGAVGAALHARDEIACIREEQPDYQTRFRGFAVADKPFRHEEEVCQRNPKCHNQCKLQIYRVGDQDAIYGGDCGRYETSARSVRTAPDLQAVRQRIWLKAMEGKLFTLEDLDRGEVPEGRPVMGIPRSLHFHQLGLFWVHLLHGLGFTPVVTEETNEEIVNAGIAAMTCEACFPVKLSHGHTQAIKDRVDYLFLPVLVEMESNSGEGVGWYCPLQQGNYHMLKAAVGLEEARCIHPEIHLQEGRVGMEKSFQAEFKRIGLKLRNFQAAWKKARAAQTVFEQEIRNRGRAVLEKLGNRRAVVVVSRPYALYDVRTNLDLFKTFSRLGMTAIPMDFLDLEDVGITGEYPNMYWGFGDRILRAGRLIAGDDRLFGLYLTSFSCGPDSFILHYFNHEMNRTGKPFLELELDEHSAGAGVETRVLAFLDVIKNFEPVKKKPSVAVPAARDFGFFNGRTMYVPFMGESSMLLSAAFEAVGIRSEVAPTYTAKGLEFAKRNTSGKECFPCTVTTGDLFDLITKIHEAGGDVEKEVAFFMPQTEGPCRFGQYSRLHRMLLDTYGYGKVEILSPCSDDAYRLNGLLSAQEAREFRKLGYLGLAYGDLLEKALWRLRPYEIEPGTASRAYRESFEEGVAAMREGGAPALEKAARRAARRFTSVKTNGGSRPRVGIIGEIYVRCHKYTNQDLVMELEREGIETYTASVTEWINYSTAMSLQIARRKFDWTSLGAWKKLGAIYLTERWQQRSYARLFAPFARLLVGSGDHPVAELLRNTEGLLTRELQGEAVLSIGAAIAFVHSGFDGVVNAMPFTCMPSTIASSILKVRMRSQLPYIDMVYDGTVLPNRMTKLSTFAHQVHQAFQEKNSPRL